MSVREDEIVYGRCDEQLTSELHLMFIFALKLEHTFVMGVTTALGTESRNREGLPRMQHTVQQLVDRTIEHSLNKQIFSLLATQTIAVPHETTLSVDHHELRFAIDVRPERAGEIVLHPHIVIARKVVDFNSLLVQLLQECEQGDIASRHHIAILKPVIENVAQEKQMA